MPDFEVLDVKIASALNKIIQNTRFNKKVSLEEMKSHKEDRFLRGRQIACHGGQNDYQNNSKIILICNRTNKKKSGKKIVFGVGNR